MNYSSSEMTDRQYSKPLVAALGTYYSSLAEDKQYYSGLCRSLVAGFAEPWRLLEAVKAAAAPELADTEFQWQRWKLSIIRSSLVHWLDGTWRTKLPEGVTSASFLGSLPSLREALSVRGVGFEIVQQGSDYWLSFESDPFVGGDFEIANVIDDANEVVDERIEVWLAEVGSGIYPLEANWGAVFGIASRTESARSLLLNLLKGFGSGPSSQLLQIGAGRAFGHPVCEVDQEVVELVSRDRRGWFVVTTSSVYRFPEEAEIDVETGDVLRLGQPISTAVRWYDLSRGIVPDLPGLAVGRRDLGSNYSGGLVFPNELKELLVTSQADRTKVSVELGGSETDQTTFWDEVHTRGVAGGVTLANHLDIRPNPVGEPAASNLPPELNPYTFLVSEALRYHTVIVELDYTQRLNYEGAVFLSRWRDAIPSHQTIHSHAHMGVEDSIVSFIEEPDSGLGMGLVMSVEGGYYGLGTSTADGGNPVITEGI